MGETISVAWPAAPLSEPRWREQLTDLATKAESLVGQPCSLQDTATLALELVGLLWPVIGAPETIAATCRASMLVGPPGIVAASPGGDQLAEVHARLDQVWLEAQQHPGAGVVQLAPPMLQQVVPSPKPRTPRKPKRAALAPAPADGDELPEAWRNCAEPQQHPVAALAVIEQQPPAPSWPVPPGSWWPAGELGELVGLTRSSICRRRRAGELGKEGTGWRKFGGTHFYAPEIVGRLETEKAANKKPLSPK